MHSLVIYLGIFIVIGIIFLLYRLRAWQTKDLIKAFEFINRFHINN